MPESSAPPLNKRRAHHKSRLGCKNCKIRKTKCDERKPACNNCVKRDVRCDFLDGDNPSRNPSPRGLDMSDLELLHNYNTMTCTTLSESLVLREFYRVSVVQIGLGHEYIMHAILAVSGLHLAHFRLHGRQHYQSLAIVHHQAASKLAMPLISNVSPASAQMLFLFSVLTTYYALGSPRTAEDALLLGGSTLPEWLYLLRGVRGFVTAAGIPAHGPLAPLFKHANDRFTLRDAADEAASSSSPASAPLCGLRDLIAKRQQQQHQSPLPDDQEQHRRDVYLRAIDELRKSFAQAYDVAAGAAPYELIDAFIWLFLVAEELLPLLQEPTQEALAILAFFCVLLNRLDGHWWIRGWGRHLMERVYLLLDEERRLWVRWPLEEVGWVPPSAGAGCDGNGLGELKST